MVRATVLARVRTPPVLVPVLVLVWATVTVQAPDLRRQYQPMRPTPQASRPQRQIVPQSALPSTS